MATVRCPGRPTAPWVPVAPGLPPVAAPLHTRPAASSKRKRDSGYLRDVTGRDMKKHGYKRL